VFDVIGKRNWFFAFSLLLTIPGLIFILLGPVTGGKVGLQYAIDFTSNGDVPTALDWFELAYTARP